MQKKYKAVFFDWDGTAVFSRKAPADAAVEAMRPLLQRGVKLAIISGTTIENLAGGKLAEYFTAKELENLISVWEEARIITTSRRDSLLFSKIWFRRKKNC